MDPKNTFIQSLSRALKGEFAGLTEQDIAASVSYCEPKFGEFSTNLVFRLSKTAKQNPKDVASTIILSSKPIFWSRDLLMCV